MQELVERAESDDRVGSVGCKVVQLEGSRRYGLVFFTGKGLFIGPPFFGSTIGREHVYSIYETSTECVANSAAAVLYRKTLIDTIGLFDPDFWADWEDHDIGFRNVSPDTTTCIRQGPQLFTKGELVTALSTHEKESFA